MTDTNTIAATPAKLRNGTWGARVTDSAKAGDVVTITTRAGKSWDAVIDSIVWTGDGVSLCTTSSAKSGSISSYGRAKSAANRAARGGTKRCTDCGKPAVDCRRHKAMHGLCGECAFDEYDC